MIRELIISKFRLHVSESICTWKATSNIMQHLLVQEWGKRNEVLLGPEDINQTPLSNVSITVYDDGDGTKLFCLPTTPSIIEIGTPLHFLGQEKSLWDDHDEITPWDDVNAGIYYRFGYSLSMNRETQKKSSDHVDSEVMIHVDNPNGTVKTKGYLSQSENTDIDILINDMMIESVDFDGKHMQITSLSDLTRVSHR